MHYTVAIATIYVEFFRGATGKVQLLLKMCTIYRLWLLIFVWLSFNYFLMDFFISSSQEHQRREKSKARELRTSPWWKNQLGKGICYHCGQRFLATDLTMDHLIPIARGGLSKKGNVVPSCKPCNTKKGYKTSVDQAFEELKQRESES